MEPDTCDVDASAPPGPEKPLPEFGDLFKKRHAKSTNAKALEIEERKHRKRMECMEAPLKEKCIPNEIVLPYMSKVDDVARYLETDGTTGSGPTNLMRGLRVARGKVTFPGWLVDLTDPQLQSAIDAKKMLASGKPICELIDPFYQAICGLGTEITEDQVKEILRRTPLSPKGWSFSHFMFIAGNPAYARKKGILQDPLPSELVKCNEEGGGASGLSSKTNMKKKKNVVDRLYQLPNISKSDAWPDDGSKTKTTSDESGYSLNEQVFYSALLYCEMFETMQAVQRLYTEGETIPEPRDKFLKRQQRAGFGVSNLGTRKLGFAEWDRPLPPLPKISPYISDFPLVGMRRKIVKPSGEALLYKRSQTSLRPLFLAVRAPGKPEDTIKIIADSRRVKSILDLLASKGNCLAMLPNVHCVIHLSDTFLNKVEEIFTLKGPELPKIYRNNDLMWITKEAKNLFRPHGLPTQIAKIPPLITYTDGLKLREICKQVRDQHWSYICLRKIQFRDTVWQLMHVERIPCGNLRESFVYSFLTYLPPKSYFPIIRTDPCPW